MTSLLRSCIIDSSYRIPDELNSAITLTQAGNNVANYLIRKDDVQPKEARLLCLLIFAYEEPLVDVENTNLEKLIDALSKQLIKRDIQHPYIFGRLLYDRMSDLYSDERDYLNQDDTLRLLDDTPVGVFQVDVYVTGPFGILTSDTARNLPPTTKPPLQHCIDPACVIVHPIRLMTSHDAPINRSFSKIYEYLEKNNDDPADWSSYLANTDAETPSSFNDNSLFSVVYGIGEQLSVQEIRVLLTHLMDNGAAKSARVVLEGRGNKGPSAQLCRSLTHAELMQLILLQPDTALVAAIDELVLGEQIKIPNGEVRTLKLHRNFSQGTWALQPEISSLGFRCRSLTDHIAVLRLRRLVSDLYEVGDEDDAEDLDWLLRNVSGTNIEGRREEYLRKTDPGSIVRTFVLHRRSKLRKSYNLLILEPHDELSDPQIVDRILWRLGFNIIKTEQVNSDFWRLHKSISDLAHTSVSNSTAGEEAVSNAAGAYFPSVEKLLEDTLVYSSWCLLVDHVTESNPFMFDADSCRSAVFDMLNGEISGADTSGDKLGSNNTIYPLINGFSLLSKKLQKLDERPDDHGLLKRTEFPSYVGKTTLKIFPFMHVHPYLDLTQQSRGRVLACIRDFHGSLVRSNVHVIRNELLHYRRSVTDPSSVSSMLDQVREAVLRAERNGLVRVRYERTSRVVDEWGRSVTTLSGASGGSVEISRPTPYDWLGMPSLHSDQYLFHCAVFDEPNEVLRFEPLSQSDYAELWSGFPRRPAAPKAAIAMQAQADGTGDLSARAEVEL